MTRFPSQRLLLVTVALAVAWLGAGVAQTIVDRFPGKVIISSSALDALTVTGGTIVNGNDIVLLGADPAFNLRETAGASADEGNWRLFAFSGDLYLRTVNDGLSAEADILKVTRTGTTVDQVFLYPSKTIFPAGSVAAPSIALTEAVGTANDSGLLWSSGSVVIGVNGSTVASFNNSGSTLTGPVQVTAPADRPLDVNRNTNDGTLVSLMQAGSEEGTISVSGATISYNAFMGSHYTQLRHGQEIPDQGTVVVTTGQVIPSKRALGVAPEGDKFVYVAPSTGRNQRGVYGVWFAELDTVAAWGDPSQPVYQVAGLGLYTVWVTDTCGPITRGVLLATSPRTGLAERQCDAQIAGRYDGVVRDYTLGKALVDVDWATVPRDADGVRKVRIPVVLMAG